MGLNRARQLPCKLPSYILAMVEARRPPEPIASSPGLFPLFLSFPSHAVPYEGINSNLIKSRQQRETSRRHSRQLPRCAETRNATAGTCNGPTATGGPRPPHSVGTLCITLSLYIVEPTFWLSEHRGNVPKMTAGETPLRGSRSTAPWNKFD